MNHFKQMILNHYNSGNRKAISLSDFLEYDYSREYFENYTSIVRMLYLNLISYYSSMYKYPANEQTTTTKIYDNFRTLLKMISDECTNYRANSQDIPLLLIPLLFPSTYKAYEQYNNRHIVQETIFRRNLECLLGQICIEKVNRKKIK